MCMQLVCVCVSFCVLDFLFVDDLNEIIVELISISLSFFSLDLCLSLTDVLFRIECEHDYYYSLNERVNERNKVRIKTSARNMLFNHATIVRVIRGTQSRSLSLKWKKYAMHLIYNHLFLRKKKLFVLILFFSTANTPRKSKRWLRSYADCVRVKNGVRCARFLFFMQPFWPERTISRLRLMGK